MPIRNEAARAEIVRAVVRWANSAKMTTLEKDHFARDLAKTLRIDYDELVENRLLQIMSPDEVSAAAKAGVQIELHTHRHRTPRDRDLFQREIRDNRARILEYTGRDPVHFCYPSGDYSQEFLPWLRDLNVKSATTCELGLAKQASEPLLLPRLLDAMNVADADFESWLLGMRTYFSITNCLHCQRSSESVFFRTLAGWVFCPLIFFPAKGCILWRRYSM